jgi:hypothetical protein
MYQPHTTFLFLTSTLNDDYITNKIKELAQHFGKDFWIIWDNKGHPECLHKMYAQCIDDWPISNTTKLHIDAVHKKKQSCGLWITER